MEITITCPNCSNAIEVDDQWAGRKAQCPYCQQQFVIPGAKTPQQYRQAQANALPRPKMLMAGVITLYVLLGLSLIGNITDGINISAIAISALLLWGTYRIQQGSKKARIAVTIACGVLCLLLIVMAFCGMGLVGFILSLFYAVPASFLWLPQCNDWFRRQP